MWRLYVGQQGPGKKGGQGPSGQCKLGGFFFQPSIEEIKKTAALIFDSELCILCCVVVVIVADGMG